jgi:hypothetical protein
MLLLLASCSIAGDPEQAPPVAVDSADLALTVGTETEVCDQECKPIAIDQMKSLVVTDPKILARFPIRRVLDQLIAFSGSSNTADQLWTQWWESERVRTGGDPPTHPFCDDNGGAINGFAIQCPRDESKLAKEVMETHTPVALFNRFDLAPLDGSNCGEYRIVYEKGGLAVPAKPAIDPQVQAGRETFIFEGVLPNPDPECGLAACLPVVQFWQDLTTEPDVNVRGDLLEDFYFKGICGFEPVVAPEHYGLGCKDDGKYGGGCGQIRTDQFIQAPWTLREFHLAQAGTELLVDPVTVKANPHVSFFTTGTDPAFNSDYSSNLMTMLPTPDDINGISLATDGSFNAGESISQSALVPPPGNLVNDYITAPGSPLDTATNAALAGIYFPSPPPITRPQLDLRATTQSCAGCHQLSNFDNLGTDTGGPTISWPDSLKFVQIDEASNLSHALTNPGMFLDHREQVMFDFLNTTCGTKCVSAAADLRFVKVTDRTQDDIAKDPTPLAEFDLVSERDFEAMDAEGKIAPDDTLSGHHTD